MSRLEDTANNYALRVTDQATPYHGGIDATHANWQSVTGLPYFVNPSGTDIPIWSASTSPLTTKGDILTYSTVPARLGIGANNTVFVADSAQATGNKWTSALTGLTIDNTIIGGTTPAAGTFTTIAASSTSGLLMSQGAETTLQTMLDMTPKTASQPHLRLQYNSFTNAGGGAGTYNHGYFLGYNTDTSDGGTPVASKPTWFFAMEDNYFDNLGDGLYGAEAYIRFVSLDGTSVNTRPFYIRVTDTSTNAAKRAIIKFDIGTDTTASGGQFSVWQNTTHLIDILKAGITVNTSLTITSNVLAMTGAGAIRVSGSSNIDLSVASNTLTAGKHTIVNAWGNSSNPGIVLGTTRTDGTAFTVASGVTLDGSGYPSSDGTAILTIGGNGSITLLGSGTIASGASATWDGIKLGAATATISGSTNITTAAGFNYVSFTQPTLSAASALTVTNAATVYIANSPTGAGAGPVTITNAYSFWVDDGTTRLDGITTLLGSATIASATSATWKGIEFRAATATITGNTAITTAAGFNYIDIAQPTLSAASALTVTSAATLYIANAPTGGGAGPATITNAYAIWIGAGIARFDGNVRFNNTGGTTTFTDNNNIVLGTSTGTKIGTATTQLIGFYNATPIAQRSGAAQAAVVTTASTNTTPFGYTTAAQADAIVTLANELRAWAVAQGFIKGSA